MYQFHGYVFPLSYPLRLLACSDMPSAAIRILPTDTVFVL